MSTRRFQVLIACLCLGVAGGLQAAANMRMGPGGMMNCSMARHYQAMRIGIPAPYAGMRNPLAPTQETLEAGKKHFLSHCASCHGEQGYGDGPAALALNPPPPNLHGVLRRGTARDDYLMWTISEGGKAFGSAMPAYKETLSEEARWQIIHFLRNL